MERTNSADELHYGKPSAQRIAAPMLGKIVEYVSILPEFIRENNPLNGKRYAAIVTEKNTPSTDLYVNMAVFSHSASNPCEGKFSVPHKSIAQNNESYWQYDPND